MLLTTDINTNTVQILPPNRVCNVTKSRKYLFKQEALLKKSVTSQFLFIIRLWAILPSALPDILEELLIFIVCHEPLSLMINYGERSVNVNNSLGRKMFPSKQQMKLLSSCTSTVPYLKTAKPLIYGTSRCVKLRTLPSQQTTKPHCQQNCTITNQTVAQW